MALQGALAPAGALGQELTALFPPKPAGYVTDLTGVVPPASTARLTALAERLRGATGAELAIAVLPTIGDRAAVDVAVAIGRAWGVGARAAAGDPRRNAGLVMLLVPRVSGDPNSGQLFIATGQGLEGIVTDLQAGRTRDLMRPYLSRGEYGPGLEAGAAALAALIAREMGVSDSALAAGDRLAGDGSGLRISKELVWVAIVLIFLVLRVAANSKRGRRRRRGGFWDGGGFWGGGFGGFGGGGFGGFGGGHGGGGHGGGFGGFGGGGGFSGGGAGGRF